VSIPLPWPPGSATGVGSMPGVDPGEAMRVVTGELDTFPHLIELPAAGVGADLVGRGAAHLVGLHVDVQPSGWRFAAHEGGDERRARGMLARDLDVLEEHTQGYVGPLKLQVAGPWTLVSSLELHYGDKALADAGAVRDITAALAEGIAGVAKDVANRVPGAAIVVQFDEPLIAAVLLGRVPTASGFGTLRVVEPPTVIERLKVVVDAVTAVGATPIAHCCAASPPVGLLVEAGMRAVSLDATILTERDDDELGEAVESGVALFLGLVPSLDVDPVPRIGEIVAPARRLWSRLGFAPENLTRDVVVTPTCGLAGSSPSWPRTAYRICREAAIVLLEAPEENS
jgi:Cobalamin-independent synthase, Catalytic domain